MVGGRAEGREGGQKGGREGGREGGRGEGWKVNVTLYNSRGRALLAHYSLAVGMTRGEGGVGGVSSHVISVVQLSVPS